MWVHHFGVPAIDISIILLTFLFFQNNNEKNKFIFNVNQCINIFPRIYVV